MKNKTNINIEQVESIINEAAEAAQRAAIEYFSDSLTGRDCVACGFAWIHIRNIHGNSKLAKKLAEYGITKDYSGALCWWNPSRHFAQNIDVKEAGAVAAAEVLRKYGFTASACSRLD